MEIYKNKTNWKWLLAVMGSVIVVLSMIYSQYLTSHLRNKEEKIATLFAEALKSINNQTDAGQDLILEGFIVSNLGGDPIIIENEKGEYTGYHFIEKGSENKDQEYLKGRIKKLESNGAKPIEGIGYAHKIYLENSYLYRNIKYFPLVQILLLSTFMAFGYYLFSTSRRAEQNRVWAGMAKETAHQLGTPITAILGWIEHLRESTKGNDEQQEIIEELRNDVTRLELIADRFSKIGSKPELKKVDLQDQIDKVVRYMQKRASRKMEFNVSNSNPVNAHINTHLFDWVVENLIRNALDAMEGVGKITVEVLVESDEAQINISDTGKGIPANKFKTIFNPGYTTKKRGWGLGLSLAKRIIEEYHKGIPANKFKTIFNPGYTTKKRGWGLGLSLAKRIIEEYHKGKIFVKKSKPNEGTTFCIKLPLA